MQSIPFEIVFDLVLSYAESYTALIFMCVSQKMREIALKHINPKADINKLYNSFIGLQERYIRKDDLSFGTLKVDNSPLYFQIHISSKYIDKIEFDMPLSTKVLNPQSEWHSFEMQLTFGKVREINKDNKWSNKLKETLFQFDDTKRAEIMPIKRIDVLNPQFKVQGPISDKLLSLELTQAIIGANKHFKKHKYL
jgi:hypothetical protein